MRTERNKWNKMEAGARGFHFFLADRIFK